MRNPTPTPHPLLFLAAGGLTLLAACAQSSAPPGDSSLSLALTDAPSEEIASFVVEIESFQIMKASGAVASVLSVPVTLDLASLTEFSQVLNIVTVPAGAYTQASATFDFSAAVAVLHGQSTPATLLDSAGQPLDGVVSLPLEFAGLPLLAVAGKHQLLELDVDLDLSTVVDELANTIALEPVLVLRANPIAPKQLLAIGTLVSTDSAAGTFTAEVKTLGSPASGTLEFLVGSGSVFQIDGVPSLRAAGLAVLAGKPAGTPIQVYGSVDPSAPRILAVAVAAGTGTYNGGSDIVEGWVTARSSGAGSSPTLSVHGFGQDAAHQSFLFDSDFDVATSLAATKVVLPGSILPLDLDDVNIGQRVRIFGALSGTSLDASGAGDVIRLQPTFAYGFADAAPAGGQLQLALARIGPLSESDFTWSDSGTTPTLPAAFVAEVGGLGSGLGLTGGTPVEVRGFFRGVDLGGADFTALSLTNLELAPSLLFVRDLPGVGLTLTLNASTNQVILNLGGTLAAGEAAVIDQGFVGLLPLPGSPPPTLVRTTSGQGLYLVKDAVLGQTRLHLTFAAFASDLTSVVAGGAHVRQVAGVGTYDALANELTAPLACVAVE